MANLKEGFRFRPTDGEGLTFLLKFIAGQALNDSGFITTNVDVYGKQEPWEIYRCGVACGADDGDESQYRFFITKLKKKNESMYRRNVGNKGSWKQQDKGRAVRKGGSGPVIGYKKSMSYVNKGMGYNRKNGHWLMKEYELSTAILEKFCHDCRDYVLCAIKKRTTMLLDNLEQETTAFLNFQESTSNTNYDEPLQGVLNAGDYMQKNPTSELDSLDQLHPLIEKRTTMLLDNNNLEDETTAFLNFQESALESTSYVYDEPLQGVVIKPGDYTERNSEPELDALQFHPLTEKNLEELGVMLHDMREDEDLNIAIEPLLAPYTSEAASMPWHNILLDSNDIDQILHGI